MMVLPRSDISECETHLLPSIVRRKLLTFEIKLHDRQHPTAPDN